MQLLVLLVYGWLWTLACGYRLNVPRVLLPYHPTTQVKFELIVSDPEGGCFAWRSTRPEVVSVQLMGKGRCSDRAVIAATSKHPNEQTAIVFAEDGAAGVVLSCGVTVDVVRSISISTTTKVLFLDASPAQMAVHALNSAGDMFSNLGDIPFEWRLESASAAERPLRIVPFAQSKYEAPEGVEKLEANKKRGYVVLVEGVSTGVATLRAKLVESHFADVASHEIELMVVANLLLVPSMDVYVPLGAILQYSAEIVKQSATEPISLPSRQYKLRLDNPSVCSLDEATSRVTAIAIGSTKISLVDENVKSGVLKPSSAHIYVVEPVGLSFAIGGNSWYLEVGREYEISVQLTDIDDNLIFVPDNARLETSIPTEYMKVLSKVANGSHFHVRAIQKGLAKLKSTFVSIKNANGKELRISSLVSAEQPLTISLPVKVTPRLVVFPFLDGTRSHALQLKAEGGTGVYVWVSVDPTVVGVNGNGVLASGRVGTTRVVVRDASNILHLDEAEVRVVPPGRLAFGTSALEAEVGSTLILSLAVFSERRKAGEEPNRMDDCTNVRFTFALADSSFFRVLQDGSHSPLVFGGGCSSVALKAIASGDTVFTFSLGNVSASTHVSAYPPLKLEGVLDPLVAIGSDLRVRSTGGPRPWILDPTGYFSKVENEKSERAVTHRVDDNGEHIVTCDHKGNDFVVRVRVGNKATPSNPQPASAVAEIRLCCAVPSRLAVSIERSSLKGLPQCPTNSRAISSTEPTRLAVRGFGRCDSGRGGGAVERPFDSISSLQLIWRSLDLNLLRVDGVFGKTGDDGQVFGVAKPQGRLGSVDMLVKASSYRFEGRERDLGTRLEANIALQLVKNARIEPSEILVWNSKAGGKVVDVIAGSGHFALAHAPGQTPAAVTVQKGTVQVVPQYVGKMSVAFVDICLGNEFVADISVTDLQLIEIHASNFVELAEEVSLTISVFGPDGVLFSSDDVRKMDLRLVSSSDDVVSLIQVDALKYRVSGKSVGVTSLSASARTASDRLLRSVPHDMQVFAKLQLLPKLVTLVPNSVFQLEVLGGPQPNPPISFNVNNSGVAKVADNGLIASSAIGITTVTGSLSALDDVNPSTDTIVVKVVSLVGVRLRLSSTRVERGTRLWARVEGLADDETPFAFGGAIHPLHVSWNLGTPGLLESLSQFGSAMNEEAKNCFQVMLSASAVGQTQLRVTVRMDDREKLHFRGAKVFYDDVTVTVLESPELRSPNVKPTSIRMMPGSKVQLEAKRAESGVSFSVPPYYEDVLGIEGDGNTVLSANRVAVAAIVMQRSSFNESIFIPVTVVPGHSMQLELTDGGELLTLGEEDGVQKLSVLPVGLRFSLRVSVRDFAGRLFDATSVKVAYRPHRFDLTEIVSSVDGFALEVHLKEEGETVLMVWDREKPSLNAFLRIPVGNVIQPSISTTTADRVGVYDVVCFKCPLRSLGWREVASGRHFEFVDDRNGIAIAEEPGTAVIAADLPSNQTIFTKASVGTVDEIRFGESPPMVSDILGRRFVFPVFLGDKTKTSNIHGCEGTGLEILEGRRAPFDCVASFEGTAGFPAGNIFGVYAVFNATQGSYSCVLEKLPFNHPVIEEAKLTLLVRAIFNRAGKVLETSAATVFYPRFEVQQTELRLNNVQAQKAQLTIISVGAHRSSLKLDACLENIVIISKGETTPTGLVYTVKLNLNSAVLYHERLDKCKVSVRSGLTGQVEEIPITISLHGDAMKAVFRASEGVFARLANFAEYSVVLLSTLFLTAIFILLIIAFRKGYTLPYLLWPTYNAQPRASGVFASDRNTSSPGYSAWRSMTQSMHTTGPTGESSFGAAARGGGPAYSFSPINGRRSPPSAHSPMSISPSHSVSDSFGGGEQPYLFSSSNAIASPTDLRKRAA